MTAELAAINAEYGATGMIEDSFKTLMRYFGDDKTQVNTTTISSNMYAESAYAKYSQNGMAVLPP